MRHDKALEEILNGLAEEVSIQEASKDGLTVGFFIRWTLEQKAALELRDSNDPFWQKYLELLDANLKFQESLFEWSYESKQDQNLRATKAKSKLLGDLEQLKK